MFTNFSLQNENNTDCLYVYGGDNVTGEVLGEFYGGHPPPNGGIYSSSNHMLVIFKSDKNGSYTGFSASYNAINCSGDNCSAIATSSSRIMKLTPSPSSYLSRSHSVVITTSSKKQLATTQFMTGLLMMSSLLTPLKRTSSQAEVTVTSSKTHLVMTSSITGPEVESASMNGK